jgi:hypothetical protein
MKESTIHDGFKGYGGYPLAESERIIRDRILQCMNELGVKNDHCMAKARAEGREKLVSEIETLKKRIEKLRHSMEISGSGARYKFEKITADNEKRLRELDVKLESLFSRCAEMFDGLSCSETDIHIIERYTQMNEHLGEVERAFHERMKVLRLMYVFG